MNSPAFNAASALAWTDSSALRKKLLTPAVAVWNCVLTRFVPNSIACVSVSDVPRRLSSSFYFSRLALRMSWSRTISALSRLTARILPNVAEN